MKRVSLAHGFFAAAALSAALAAPPAVALADPLDREAVKTILAPRALLTAVARNGSRLIAVGERGHVLLSDDEGATWRQARVPVSVTLTAVAFADARNGWACGHGAVILHTADGGLTWNKQFDGNASPRTAGDDGIADKPLLDIHFEDTQNGFAVGAYGLAFATTDGGRHWESIAARIPNPEGKHLYALRRVGQIFYIVGEQGAIFASRDGGTSFKPVASPYKGSFFDLIPIADRTFLVVGLRGSVYRTADGGATWTRIDIPSKDAVLAGTLLRDGTLALVDGAGNLWRSTDAGKRFTGGRIATPFPLSGIVQSSPSQLAAVGARGVVVLPAAHQEKVARP